MKWKKKTGKVKMKALSLFLAAVLVVTGIELPFSSMTVKADDTVSVQEGTFGENDKLKWSYDGEGTLTISGEGAMTDLSSGAQKPWEAYQVWAGNIKKIVIEEGVTRIGNYAFKGYNRTKEVEIPASVTSIGEYAFYNCGAMGSCNIPSGVTEIGKYAFSECTGTVLRNVTIPDGMTTIAEGLFKGSNLRSITIPASVTSIEASAFEGSILGSDRDEGSYIDKAIPITIPKSVTSIGDNAFKSCHSLYIVNMDSASPPTLGKDAFTDCGIVRKTEDSAKTTKKGIKVPEGAYDTYAEAEGWSDWKDYIDGNITYEYDENTKVLTIIGEGLMDDYGQSNQVPWHQVGDVKKIVLDPKITHIGESAFAYCKIEELPDLTHVDSIGDWAFYYCNSLKTADIPENVSTVGAWAFRDCLNLEEVTIGAANIGGIVGRVFEGCTNLSNLTILEGVKAIEYRSFGDCYSLETVTIPVSVEDISGAFQGCSSLKTVIVLGTKPAKITQVTFDECAFVKDKTKGIIVPEEACEEYFKDWIDWKEYILFKGVHSSYDEETATLTYYGDSAIEKSDEDFAWEQYRSEIKHVVIEEGITGIGSEVFSGCSKLESITIPSSLVSIGQNAFKDCTALETVTVKAEVPPSIEAGLFGDCAFVKNGTKGITVPAGGYSAYRDSWAEWADYMTVDGVTCSYNEETDTLTIFGKGKMEGKRDTVTYENIYEWNQYRQNAKHIVIEEGVTNIGSSAISSFRQCESIEIAGSVEVIEMSAFLLCTALKEIKIPASVKKIESNAFTGITKGLRIVMEGLEPPEIDEYQVFPFSEEVSGSIIVPEGAYADYVAAWPEWADYIKGKSADETADKEKVEEAKGVVNNALGEIAVTNGTTKESIQALIDVALTEAGITDVQVEVGEFVKTEATSEAEGSISATVSITSGSVSDDVTLSKVIDKLKEDEDLPGGGDGTEQSPYTISSVEDLQKLAEDVNNGTITTQGKFFKLTASLDLSGVDNWTPIGNSSHTFQGTFDGGFHTISNMKIQTSERYSGLFGKLENASIKNLGIENASVTSSNDDVAILAGNAQGGTISKCYVTGKVEGSGGVSGILGSTHSSAYPTEIDNCYARVALAGKGVWEDTAGISGWNEKTSLKLTNCLSACIGEKHPIAGWSDGSAVSNSQFENTYFDKTLSSNFSTESGRADLGKTSEELKQQSIYSGWDFDNIWTLDSEVNGGYPYLRGFTPGLVGAPGSIAITLKDTVSGEPVTDAAVTVKNSENETEIPLNHQGNGVYSGSVNSTDGTYDIYVNGEKKISGITLDKDSGTAEQEVTIGTDPEKPFNGSGTAENPYKITSKEDLEKLQELVNGGQDFSGKHFQVTADINLGGGETNPWTPIGTEEHPFRGTFDGDNHKVSGLYINDETKDNQGLFGVNEGTVKNLTVAGSVEGDGNVGGIAGTNKGTIENCVNEAGITGNDNVGGIAGKNEGTVKDCTNKGRIHGGDNAGGIAGNNDGTLKNDTNTAPVTGKDYIGGIAGTNGENGTVEGCANSGNVTAAEDGTKKPGAIIGNNKNTNPGVLKDDYYQKTEEINKDLSGIGEGTGAGEDPEGITFGQTSTRPTDPPAPEKPFNGSGTLEDPYQIGSKDDLEKLRDLVNDGNDFADTYFKVTGNIALGGEANPWTPIGTEEHPFKGTFDGDGHKVSGLYVNDDTKDNQGLFGVNEGTVKNLTVAGSVEGDGNVGGIAGTNKGTIENCVNEAGITGNDNVGGIAGKNEGTIKDCTNKGEIHGGDNVGGIAGSNTGTVSGSGNTGAVSGNDNVGGITGNNTGTVNDSDNSGSVTGTGAGAGGIAGNNDGALKNDTNTAPVTGKDDIGGIAGTNGENGTVEGCANSGNVTADEDGTGTPGAIIGNNQNTDPDALKDDYYQKTNDINNEITGIGEGTGAGEDPEGITFGQTPTNPDKDSAAAKDFEDKAAAIEKASPVGGTAWKQAVKDAREAYGKLTDIQKNLVSGTAKNTLTDAEAILAVVEKIEKIGTVVNTAACGQKIKDARGAYDKLTSGQKAKIPANVKKILTDAETAYAKLTAGGKDNLTAEQKKEKEQIQTIAKQLGVSEATAAKIQLLVKEYGISAETLLLGDGAFEGQNSEGDMKGSTFSLLQAKASKVTEKSAKLTWKKMKGADGYQIYGAPCGKGNKAKLLTTIQTNGKTSYTQKKLKKGTAYRYIVRAYKTVDGKKITIAASKSVHIFTQGGKYGNAKSVKLKNVKKSSISIKKGKTFKIKASEVKEKKPLKRHRALSYESSDTTVATVTAKGAFKAMAKGKCTIFVYSQNGMAKSIKVTVK